MNVIELERRLVSFAKSIIRLCKVLNNDFVNQHLSKQIIRSSTSAALNFGEAQAAESRNDFIHKSSLVLKELRETQICLQLLHSDSLPVRLTSAREGCHDECSQLVAIFQKTVSTARKNNKTI